MKITSPVILLHGSHVCTALSEWDKHYSPLHLSLPHYATHACMINATAHTNRSHTETGIDTQIAYYTKYNYLIQIIYTFQEVIICCLLHKNSVIKLKLLTLFFVKAWYKWIFWIKLFPPVSVILHLQVPRASRLPLSEHRHKDPILRSCDAWKTNKMKWKSSNWHWPLQSKECHSLKETNKQGHWQDFKMGSYTLFVCS